MRQCTAQFYSFRNNACATAAATDSSAPGPAIPSPPATISGFSHNPIAPSSPDGAASSAATRCATAGRSLAASCASLSRIRLTQSAACSSFGGPSPFCPMMRRSAGHSRAIATRCEWCVTLGLPPSSLRRTASAIPFATSEIGTHEIDCSPTGIALTTSEALRAATKSASPARLENLCLCQTTRRSA